MYILNVMKDSFLSVLFCFFVIWPEAISLTNENILFPFSPFQC